MKILNKKEAVKKLKMDTPLFASVCNSCSCGCSSGGYSCGGSACKGCTDKGENVVEVKKIYGNK